MKATVCILFAFKSSDYDINLFIVYHQEKIDFKESIDFFEMFTNLLLSFLCIEIAI
jgi:hypothetical protein